MATKPPTDMMMKELMKEGMPLMDAKKMAGMMATMMGQGMTKAAAKTAAKKKMKGSKK